MNQSSRKVVQLDLRRKLQRRFLMLSRRILRFWGQILVCSLENRPIQYHMLPEPIISPFSSPSPPAAKESVPVTGNMTEIFHTTHDKDSDLVPLKISLLGDCQIGKTSFLAKYVGNEKEDESIKKKGLNLMDKTLMVEGARISYCLWEVDGEIVLQGKNVFIPLYMVQRLKDLSSKFLWLVKTLAILIMFDLTSRVTLNGVIQWYQEARKWNQTAIPVLIGTKFDDFIQLPIDLQWAIASQARAYSKALKATLFFSSATYNINVSKIFKFITAKLFDLPWTVERNLTLGEPIIDF